MKTSGVDKYIMATMMGGTQHPWEININDVYRGVNDILEDNLLSNVMWNMDFKNYTDSLGLGWWLGG